VLLGNQVADELILLNYPVLIGTGKRLFSDTAGSAIPRELSLQSSKTAPSGSFIYDRI
jgi:dihydrofolate reductase